MTAKQIKPELLDSEMRNLYETAFPENEQILWEDLKHLLVVMSLDFTAYYNEEDLVGFTIVYPRPSFNWFWYFAVKPELRGKGLGQQILSLLLEKYKDSSNILDMESPAQLCENHAQRQRRHDFYLRNGFRDTGVGKTFGDVDMTIMMIGEGSFTMKDYDEVLQELQSYWEWDENNQ